MLIRNRAITHVFDIKIVSNPMCALYVVFNADFSKNIEKIP